MLDEICLRKTRGLNIEDSLATILHSITELTYKKINSLDLSQVILVGGGRKPNFKKIIK